MPKKQFQPESFFITEEERDVLRELAHLHSERHTSNAKISHRWLEISDAFQGGRPISYNPREVQ